MKPFPTFPRSAWRLPALALLLSLAARPAAAEVCWAYTDAEPAKVPLKCVQMGNPALSCSWNGGGEFCNVDSDPSDCCMAVYDPAATQTIGEMHLAWHDCLGNVGTNASPPPPNRGLRWYAFHRQFEADFNVFREDVGFPKIDPLEWCPGMDMPYGHFGAGLPFGAHPLGCGTGINRPDNVTCDTCVPFRKCLYLNGAGPANCPAGGPVCSIAGVSFPYTQLDQFQNADEIATLLDVYFHGQMHGAVGVADGGGYNNDVGDPNCSPRDPMFWRLHKALDEVVRAWQNVQAVDVTLVIDRSGSMSAPSGTGVGTRLENAVEAADMFGDLLEDGRSDGAVNRIGIVSYASDAANAALNMPLQNVTPTLRDPGGPFADTLAALVPGGNTSIGSGVVAALGQLCPGGTCASYVPPPGENERKAILLLTDGQENRAPCLEAGCQFGVPGGEIDYTTLDVTQACAVGLGNAASVNGELLTIFTERQGGIYLNNTDSTGEDLKDFFTKCFAQLTDEFVGLDPNGTLAAAEPAGPIVPYESCDDKRITFTAGWNPSPLPGDRLNLLVTTPAGDAWVPAAGYGEMSTEPSWAFKRCPLPYGLQDQGVWNMQLVRPQQAFVNGFASDGFADLGQGVRVVRRQLQRLCPLTDGGQKTCNRVLFFEDGVRGASAYDAALRAETGTTVKTVVKATGAADLDRRLQESWDLVVYARQAGADASEVYDRRLADQICRGTRAIVTDTRSVTGAAEILRCAGAARVAGSVNLKTLTASDRFLDGAFALSNPGYPVFSYGVASLGGGSASSLDASFTAATGGSVGAIAGKALRGGPLNWHKNVLVTGLSQLTAFAPFTVPRTGDPLGAAVRILPSFNRAGGYPGSNMTVTVERPTVGLGSLVKKLQGEARPVEGDAVGALEQQLGKIRIPSRREVYTLNDEGRNGDQFAGNGTFSAELPISAAVDGMYTFHYVFEYPAGSCRARRELKQSLFVALKVSPEASQVQVGPPIVSSGGKVYPVRMRPQDALGNVAGPGRAPHPVCAAPCSCDAREVADHLDGSYTLPIKVPGGADISSCSLEAFGATFTFRGGGSAP